MVAAHHQTQIKNKNASQDVLKLQRKIGKSQEQQDPLIILEKLAEEFNKVALADRTLRWEIAQWKEWKRMRYRFHSSGSPEISAEAEALDCVLRDGLGNRWGQKPTGPSRKRTL